MVRTVGDRLHGGNITGIKSIAPESKEPLPV